MKIIIKLTLFLSEKVELNSLYRCDRICRYGTSISLLEIIIQLIFISMYDWFDNTILILSIISYFLFGIVFAINAIVSGSITKGCAYCTYKIICKLRHYNISNDDYEKIAEHAYSYIKYVNVPKIRYKDIVMSIVTQYCYNETLDLNDTKSNEEVIETSNKIIDNINKIIEKEN